MREIGWELARAWLDRIHDRLAILIDAVDPEHPLHHRWKHPHMNWIRLRQNLEISTAHHDPPWNIINREKALRNGDEVGYLDGLECFNK